MLVKEDSGGNRKGELASVTEVTATQTLSRGLRVSPGHRAHRARSRQPVGKRQPCLRACGPGPGSACGQRLPRPKELDTDASCPEPRRPTPAVRPWSLHEEDARVCSDECGAFGG